MPSAKPPMVSFDCGEISLDEVMKAVKRTKSSSSPSPFDAIPYTIYKQCPSLALALQSLFNACWSTASVPELWKMAAIKLIAIGQQRRIQPSHQTSDQLPSPHLPANYSLPSFVIAGFHDCQQIPRPVCSKGILPVTLGCVEHHLKLSSVLGEARKKHKSLTVCWLDLANAYGSVHHSLIDFSLTHYYAPPQFQNFLKAFYTDLSASVSTKNWSTPLISLEVRVYQGDPLSVVVFNTLWLTLCRLGWILASLSLIPSTG